MRRIAIVMLVQCSALLAVSAAQAQCQEMMRELNNIRNRLSQTGTGYEEAMGLAARGQQLQSFLSGCREQTVDPHAQQRALDKARDAMIAETQRYRLEEFKQRVQDWAKNEREKVVRLYDSTRNALSGPQTPIPDILKPSSYQDPFGTSVPKLPTGELSAFLKLGPGAPGSGTPVAKKPDEQKNTATTAPMQFPGFGEIDDLKPKTQPTAPTNALAPNSVQIPYFGTTSTFKETK
jgi:hypothetical protein